MEKRFDWIPFYEELAIKLLNYKDNRKELLDIVYDPAISDFTHYLREDGKSLDNIDPFTIYGIFNRGSSDETRRNICIYFKDKFSLKSNIPSSFSGIPVVDSRKSRFFSHQSEHWVDDINNLWDLLYSITNNMMGIDSIFDKVIQQAEVKFNITMSLYWILPNKYLALDSRNRAYLKHYGIMVNGSKVPNYDEYISIMDSVKEKMEIDEIKEKSFPEFSYSAWMSGSEKENEDEKKKTQYWVWKHKPGTEGDEESSLKIIQKCMKGEFAEMQYEYGIQSNNNVTLNWNKAKLLKEGDILFLRGDNRLYAVGKIVVPREEGTCTLEMQKIINNTSHEIDGEKYRSDSYKGVIRFRDHSVFYENLNGEENWGQRVDVDYWRFYSQDGIEFNKGYLVKGANSYTVINELKEDKAQELIKALRNKSKRKETQLLEANFNLILNGAPGTGKTYLAKQIARQMLFGENDEGLLSKEDEDKSMEERCGFVQFHPSYDYTDFVEGLRPTPPDANGNIGFELKDGVFKELCKKAFKNPDEKYVFIIDEINRGEISKIFGELFFSIDPSYRGEKEKVKTQYQNMITDEDDPFFKGFFVPKNVYIIGTMNDIDRSVESMDFAMRRRFAFREITAEESQSMLDSEKAWKEQCEGAEKPSDDELIKLKNRMNNLNKKIVSRETNLTEAYQIGASYFLKYALYANDEKPFESLWSNHLKGLLFEYLRGTNEAGQKLQELEKAYQDEMNHKMEEETTDEAV